MSIDIEGKLQKEAVKPGPDFTEEFAVTQPGNFRHMHKIIQAMRKTVTGNDKWAPILFEWQVTHSFGQYIFGFHDGQFKSAFPNFMQGRIWGFSTSGDVLYAVQLVESIARKPSDFGQLVLADETFKRCRVCSTQLAYVTLNSHGYTRCAPLHSCHLHANVCWSSNFIRRVGNLTSK